MFTIRLDIPDALPNSQASAPVRVIDERTQDIYYLITAAQFEQVRSLLSREEFEPQEIYPLISKTAASAGWDDPQMDDYDRYDELRPAH